MRLHGWLLLGLLACPAQVQAQAQAQMLTQADILWGWRAKADSLTDSDSEGRGWLVIWPDHVWGFGGPILPFAHGGGRWRLIGDTLWLAQTGGGEDFWARAATLQAKGEGIG